MNVGENQIREALAAGATLEVLQTELRCGTGCGACMPELRRLSKQT
ncbi:MAG: (2Fe-2S)-binding protein [Azovibrio sp.]|nr:(2Fe-2S)-binding protein [Azovibrio sp.]